MEEDYGDIEVTRFDSGDEFWFLFEYMLDAQCSFVHNRHILADAFRKDQLYGLQVQENNAMYERGARMDPAFIPNSWYMLKCFCVVDGTTCDIIWVDPSLRRLGLGTKLIRGLELRDTSCQLHGSLPFWRAMGFQDKDTTNQ